MKKILLTAIVAVAALSSCQKERDCVCTYPDGSTETTPFEKASKSDQKDACDILGAFSTFAGGSCELD